jgi:hypothetical protein
VDYSLGASSTSNCVRSSAVKWAENKKKQAKKKAAAAAAGAQLRKKRRKRGCKELRIPSKSDTQNPEAFCRLVRQSSDGQQKAFFFVVLFV